ncbi:C-type lectin domain family 2 member D-related protein-like isoform X1 [Lonchura striata]
MDREQGAVCSWQRDEGCELQESEFCSTHGGVNESLENRSATQNPLRRFLGEWFSSRPVLTAVLILLLLVLVLALGVALAVQSGKGGAAGWAQPLGAERGPCSLQRGILRPSPLPPPAAQVPVTPEILQCCPPGWVGSNGVCYYLSRDSRSWDQAQERCSELGASLAILQDEAMDLLFCLRGNVDYWIGLRRRGERLHWGDGSSYSSRVPVFGNSECVFLAENRLRSENCSNEQPYVCSKAQAAL